MLQNINSDTAEINKYYRDILSIEQTSKIIPKYAVLNCGSVCEAVVRDHTTSYHKTGRESFSDLISILNDNRLIGDMLISFLDKIRAGSSFVRHDPMRAEFTNEDVKYFLEGSYEVIRSVTDEPIPDREKIHYYQTKEDYEKRLRELKSENDSIIKALSDQLIHFSEQFEEAENGGGDVDIEVLKRDNARLEEELDVAVGVAENLENSLYIIQEEMEKLKTDLLIEKTIDTDRANIRPKDFQTADIENAIILTNQGIQRITSSSGKQYDAVKLLILMDSGETATAIVRGVWESTAIHLKRNDRVNFLNVFTPNWKEARVFHVFDKYINSQIDYPVSYMVIEPDLIYHATDISSPVLRNDIFCTNISIMDHQNRQHKLTPPMIKGIIINQLLDQYFLSEGDFDFDFEVEGILNDKKLELSYCSVEEYESIVSELKQHYNNITALFPRDKNTDWPNLFEPYLLSPKYGLEGRLDLFHYNENTGRNAIYELKSGKPHTDHSYQLFVYKLTYLSCYSEKLKTAKLLYTNPAVHTRLRDPFIAPSNSKKTLEPTQLVINLRNNIVLIDMKDASIEDRTAPEIPSYMKNEELCSKCRFRKKDCLFQRDLFASIGDADEREYYNGFMKLVNRNGYIDRVNASNLWNMTVIEKKDKFSIITDLRVKDIHGQEILLTMKKGNSSDFKVGDSVFLHKGSVDSSFLFRCTIRSITGSTIAVKLSKSNISNADILEGELSIDRAVYLNGSQKERNGLYQFLTAHIHRNDKGRFKDLLLGKQKPQFDKIEPFSDNYINTLNDRQADAVFKALASQDYCLIQGPPGTGKSYTLAVMVLEMVKRGEKVLLTGFTNKSVDNALSILLNDFGFENFMRVGSFYSIDNEIKPYSIDSIIQRYSINQLDSIRNYLDNIPVIAGTTYSIDSFILSEKVFDTVLVDESSQITEPAILLAISKGRRFVLFGDHKQLPPIVNTDKLSECGFSENDAGLKSLDQSLFERLISLNTEWGRASKGISEAVAMLDIQYRMNSTIVDFPNKQFYKGILKTDTGNSERKHFIDLKRVSKDYTEYLHPSKSLLFINTRSQIVSKENRAEAKLVKNIVTELLKASIPPAEIGIITPYKAQCSLIRRLIEDIKLKSVVNTKDIIADTVERYQGGHKEIIIVSFTVSDNNMMTFLAEDNPDKDLNRKLNVAMTRARSKLILIGNKIVLSQDRVYRSLINYLEDKKLIYDPITDKQLELDMLF